MQYYYQAIIVIAILLHEKANEFYTSLYQTKQTVQLKP